ncbi:MAG: UDPGP type 1 family protein [Zavarzinella sp.]
MNPIPTDLRHRLRLHHQEHLLNGWDALTVDTQHRLILQLAGVDLEEIDQLFQSSRTSHAAFDEHSIAPIQVLAQQEVTAIHRDLGHQAIADGKFAVLLVAGGQGSRLGFPKPKGMYPIGPISQKTLFQIHAEKVLACGLRYGRKIPLILLTSPATHEETLIYLQENHYFGLDPKWVFLIQQGTMPAVDRTTGKLLLEAPGVLFTSPNGHGGTISALIEDGMIDRLTELGVEHLFYFQVDNPLVQVLEPGFVGLHIEQRSQVSSKAVAKAYPKEKMGVFATIAGKCGIVEYSDLPEKKAAEITNTGELVYRFGNPAIHMFELKFLSEISGTGLPYHIAHKKVPYIDEHGVKIEPTTENALKFEKFIFDSLPLAERWVLLETPRADEFAPVKNLEGTDTPETCQRGMIELFARWCESVGLDVERTEQGLSSHPIEISPRFASTPEELAARIWGKLAIRDAHLWE